MNDDSQDIRNRIYVGFTRYKNNDHIGEWGKYFFLFKWKFLTSVFRLLSKITSHATASIDNYTLSIEFVTETTYLLKSYIEQVRSENF